MMIYSAYLLLIFLGVSAINDFYCRKISNYWISLAIIVGLIFPWIFGGWSEVTNSYLGSLLAFALFLPPYFIGVMGAADVKAFAASGFFLGADKVFTVALNIAIFGGFLALIYLLNDLFLMFLRGNKFQLMHFRSIEIPYAVAIFGGVIFTLLIERLA